MRHPTPLAQSQHPLAALADAVVTQEPSVKQLLLQARASLRKLAILPAHPAALGDAQRLINEALNKLG